MSELAVIQSRALQGMAAPPVQVEVHLANGLPALAIVGLPDTAVREARERVRAAIQYTGLDMPRRRITVNLSPADLPKASGRFDLPIALGILAASGQLPAPSLARCVFLGELSLNGALRPVQGALATALALSLAAPGKTLILPEANAAEAALAPGITILPAPDLRAVLEHFSPHPQARRLRPQPPCQPQARAECPDLAEVRGQDEAKRAMEVAAAGGHSLLMVGPPGSGKSMLAQRFPGLLPPMSDAEALESAAVSSLDRPFDPGSWKRRPFRAPHHTASGPALVGGGGHPRPGEISLAHGGVLFLDELAEFPRHVLETLRQPMETGQVLVSRAAQQLEFPARFQLLAAMNPCPCGYLGHPSVACRCSDEQIRRYQQRLSGPLLDRIDLLIDVPPVGPDALIGPPGTPSQTLAARAAAARARQEARQGCPNAALGVEQLDTYCRLDGASSARLRAFMQQHHWSARRHYRVLRIARTLADLAGSEAIREAHVCEAIQLRRALPHCA